MAAASKVAIEVDGMKDDVTETETESNEALSEWEKGGIFWTSTGLWFVCESADNSTGGRAHSRARCQVVLFLNNSMSSLPVAETEIPMDSERRRPSGDRCVYPVNMTSLSRVLVFDPAWCLHLPGNELKID